MSESNLGNQENAAADGAGGNPENPFAPPNAPRPAEPGPSGGHGSYPSYPAAPTYGHADPTTPPPPGLAPHGPPGPAAPADPREPVFPGTEFARDAVSLDGPGYTVRAPRNHPLAVAAVTLGALAVLPGLGIGAVVCGHLALRTLREPGPYGGRGLALAGLVLGYVLTGLWSLLGLALWTQQ